MAIYYLSGSAKILHILEEDYENPTIWRLDIVKLQLDDIIKLQNAHFEFNIN